MLQGAPHAVTAWPRPVTLLALSSLVFAASACLTDTTPTDPGSDGGGNNPPAVSLGLTPDSTLLDPGMIQSFIAWVHRSDGDSATVPVNWTATGGSVTSLGRYTAGGSPGTYMVVASDDETGLTDTALIAIRDTSSAPPPPPPDDPEDPENPQGLANECNQADPTWIWCDDFDQDRLNSYFEYDDGNGSFARVASAGNENSSAMVASFGAGQVDAGSLHLAFGKTPQAYFNPVDAGTANYRELYWRFYLKNEAGWTGGGGYKLTRATSFVSPTSWAQSMFAHVWSGGNTSTRDYLVIDPASGTDVNGQVLTTTYNDFPNMRWLGAKAGQTALFASGTTGSWRCIEVHVKLNSAGASDGVFEFWIDGALEVRSDDLNWLGSYSQYGINAVFLENYWNNGAPAAQSRTFDNFVVSTEAIGC